MGNGSADSRDRKLGRVMTNVEEIFNIMEIERKIVKRGNFRIKR